MRKIKKVYEFGYKESGEDLEEIGKGETIIRKYCMKKYIFDKKGTTYSDTAQDQTKKPQGFETELLKI